MSDLQSKHTRIAEVAILEAIQKSETGETVKSGWNRLHAYNPKMPGESECGKLDRKDIGWKSTSVGAAKRDGLVRHSPAEQTIVFVQNEFETGDLRSSARVGQQGSKQGLAALRQCEDNLHTRPTAH